MLAKALGLALPEDHLMVHPTHRAVALGNPWRYTTFLDESLNKELKRVLRLCHQATFESTAFVKAEAHVSSLAARSSWQ